MGIENWLQDVQTPNSSWRALSELTAEGLRLEPQTLQGWLS